MAEAHRLVSPARVFARPTADQIWLGPAQQTALSQLSRPHRPASARRPTVERQEHAAQSPRGQLGTRTRGAAVSGPEGDPAGVLTTLLLGADLAPWELSEVEQRNLLTVFVHQRRAQGRRRRHRDRRCAYVYRPPRGKRSSDCWRSRSTKRAQSNCCSRGPPALPSASTERRMLHRDGILRAHAASSVARRPRELPRVAARAVSRWQTLLTPTATQMIARLSGGRYTARRRALPNFIAVATPVRLDRVDARRGAASAARCSPLGRARSSKRPLNRTPNPKSARRSAAGIPAD